MGEIQMDIIDIQQTSKGKGVLTLTTRYVLKDSQKPDEKQLLFDLQRKSSEYVSSRFPEYFINLTVGSFPTPEPDDDGTVLITLFVDVDEDLEGALQDASESLGMNLKKRATKD
jgi:hypothetical protein